MRPKRDISITPWTSPACQYYHEHQRQRLASAGIKARLRRLQGYIFLAVTPADEDKAREVLYGGIMRCLIGMTRPNID